MVVVKDEEHEPDKEEDPEKPPDPPRQPPPRRAQCPPPRIPAAVPRSTKHLRASPTQELNQSPASPPTRQTLLHGRREPNPQRRCLCRGSGVRMDQEAITIQRTHPPEAAGSSPATGDPTAASRRAGQRRQERRRRKSCRIREGERRNAWTARCAEFRERKGRREGEGRERSESDERGGGGEGRREGGSSSSLADVKRKSAKATLSSHASLRSFSPSVPPRGLVPFAFLVFGFAACSCSFAFASHCAEQQPAAQFNYLKFVQGLLWVGLRTHNVLNSRDGGPGR